MAIFWAVNTMVPVDWEKVDCQRRICCMREKVAKGKSGLDMSFVKSVDLTVELFKEKRTDMLVTLVISLCAGCY